jgi:hypothetical protein
MTFYDHVKGLLERVTLSCLDKKFEILIEFDKKYTKQPPILWAVSGNGTKKSFHPYGRVYIQLRYSAGCTKDGHDDTWKGRKWYLSEYMTDDEIIKTCYVAFEAAVKHEIMEGFKVDGKILFNPHINFEELLKISDKEIKRS